MSHERQSRLPPVRDCKEAAEKSHFFFFQVYISVFMIDEENARDLTVFPYNLLRHNFLVR